LARRITLIPQRAGRQVFISGFLDGHSAEKEKVDRSLSAKRVVRTLDRIIEQTGKPAVIRTDNGAEFTSKELELWAVEKGITIQFMQPGKPMQNGYIERFNRLYREAVLDAYLFFDLYQVKQLTEEWMIEYNERRPHEALNNLTPEEWHRNLLQTEKTLINTV